MTFVLVFLAWECQLCPSSAWPLSACVLQSGRGGWLNLCRQISLRLTLFLVILSGVLLSWRIARSGFVDNFQWENFELMLQVLIVVLGNLQVVRFYGTLGEVRSVVLPRGVNLWTLEQSSREIFCARNPIQRYWRSFWLFVRGKFKLSCAMLCSSAWWLKMFLTGWSHSAV